MHLWRFIWHDLRIFAYNRGAIFAIIVLILLSLIIQGGIAVRRFAGLPDSIKVAVGLPDAQDSSIADLVPIRWVPGREPIREHLVLGLLHHPEDTGLHITLENVHLARLLPFLLPIIGLIIGITIPPSPRLLAQLCALPSRRVYIIIGHLLVGMIVVGIMCLLLHLATIILFSFFPGGLHPEVLERLLYFYIISWAYTLVFVSLGIFLNQIFARPTIALAAGLAIAITMTVILSPLLISGHMYWGFSTRLLAASPSFRAERAIRAAANIFHSSARYYNEIMRTGGRVPRHNAFPIGKVLPLLLRDLGVLLLWVSVAGSAAICLFLRRRRT